MRCHYQYPVQPLCPVSFPHQLHPQWIPLEVQKRLAEIWGTPDAVDTMGAYTHMNMGKARMAKWSLIRKELHDSLSLCNWTGTWIASPLRERGYKDDDSIESMLYSLVTGDKKGREELDLTGERLPGKPASYRPGGRIVRSMSGSQLFCQWS